MLVFEKIKELVSATEEYATEFYSKENKASGTRHRILYQKLETHSQGGRNEVTEPSRRKNN